MTHPYNTIIDTQIEAFPPLPATATQVLTITSDPESSAKDLMQAILPDQMMCSVILKVANSAFFGIPRGVSSIERAIVVLGYKEIRNIVIGKAILGSIPKLPPEARQALELFWDHAFTCALAAKTLAEHVHNDPGELFIAGLIHDIGKLAMILAFPAEYALMRETADLDHGGCVAQERRSFGVSHDEAGLRLAKKWLLPEQLMMGIGYHHAPEGAPLGRQVPAIVQAADVISLLHCCTDNAEVRESEKNFNDILPDLEQLWQNIDLPWKPELLGSCFAALQQSADGEGVLSIFSAE